MGSSAWPLRWVGITGRLFAGVLSAGVALWGISYLVRDTASIPPGLAQNSAGVGILVLHAALAGMALLLGPLQFIASWRRSSRHLHRWIGRVYACACLAGGLAGVALALGTTAGPIARSGFFLLACGWIGCTALG